MATDNQNIKLPTIIACIVALIHSDNLALAEIYFAIVLNVLCMFMLKYFATHAFISEYI